MRPILPLVQNCTDGDFGRGYVWYTTSPIEIPPPGASSMHPEYFDVMMTTEFQDTAYEIALERRAGQRLTAREMANRLGLPLDFLLLMAMATKATEGMAAFAEDDDDSSRFHIN